MKKIIIICYLLLSCSITSFAQVFSFDSDVEPYMGLMDFGITYGYMGLAKHEQYTANNSSDIKTNMQFINFHADESILSNWWNADDKTRLLIGFREVLDLGVSYGTTTQVFNPASTSPAVPDRSEMGLLFSYEAGFGAVYRINKKMDAGLNYYFFSISSFNRDNNKQNYPKFRFRYSKYMAELSLKARTQIEFKYLSNPEDAITSYIGLSYIHASQDIDLQKDYTSTKNILQIGVGMQF